MQSAVGDLEVLCWARVTNHECSEEVMRLAD